MNYYIQIVRRVPHRSNIGEPNIRPGPLGFNFPHEKYDKPKRLKHFYHIRTRVE